MLPLLLSVALGAPTVRFELADEHPVAGDHLYYRLSFTNDSGSAVRVPADLFDELRIRVQVEIPWEGAAPIAYMQEPGGEPPPARRASDITWLTVPPRGTIERLGDLATSARECSDGCPAADYLLRAVLDPAPVVGGAGDQIVPAGVRWERAVQLRAPTLPIADGRALSLEITGVDRSRKEAVASLTLTNRSPVPIWIPGDGDRLFECDFAWTARRQPADARSRSAAAGGRPWNELGATLLGPGRSLDLTATCAADAVKGAGRDLTLVVRVRPAHLFVPTRATASPYHLATVISSAPAEAR